MSRPRQNVEEQMRALYDEQERVQKKTFTNWINSYLSKRVPPIKVESLFDDIKDGKILLALLETLSGEKLPGEKGAKLKRVHYVSNISNALRFLESKKIKLVNINPSDIADGKPAIVLGLIWTIILYFQIEETATRMAEQQSQDTSTPSKKMSPLEKFRVSAKKALMMWTEQAIAKRYGLNISDFGKSWRDGVAFNAIIDNISPGLVDMNQVRQQAPRVNLENAFSAAESHLGIPRLIDPEDVDVDKPDEKSIMTYVAQFMKAYPDSSEDPALRKTAQRTLTPAEQEEKDFNDMLTWIRTAEGVLKIVDKPVEDLQKEYMDYVTFKKEYDEKENTYQKIGENIRSKRAVKLTEEEWKMLQSRFLPVSDDTTRWLIKLDSQLPGELGQLGAWLVQASQVLKQEPEMMNNPDQMTAQLNTMLEEHTEFFKDADGYRKLLADVKRTGKYKGQSICLPHIEDLQKRFSAVFSQSEHRERHLRYELFKQRLLALIASTEEKVAVWSGKYGEEEEVLQWLSEYKEFVIDNRLTQTYDKMYSELKTKADAYKRSQQTDKDAATEVDKTLHVIAERWKSLASRVKTLQAVLEEGVASWKRYNTSLDWMENWISGGKDVLTKSTEEKEAYFKDLRPSEEKLKLMKDSAKRLIEKTHDPMAEEIRETVQQTSARYDDLLGGMKRAHQEEVIEKGRSQYVEGISRLESWVETTDQLLKKPVPCEHAQLKEYLQLLTDANAEVSQVEDDFKKTTKTAQSLVRDTSQEEVNKMLQTLNVHKEVIVGLRKEIPERLKAVKGVLPNVESLETGMADLSGWLDKGETLLDSHQLEGEAQSAEARLEKHKEFFAETTYQKSVLESKAKVFQKVLNTKPKLPNVDFSVLENGMESLQTRFQELLEKGEQSVNQHQEYQDASNTFLNWLRGAREKLVTCSDTYGDKTAIIGKIDKAKSLSQNLSEGTKKLMDCTVACEGTLPNTSPKGQSKLRQELQEMNKDFEDYKEELTSAQSQLEGCLLKWNDFEDGYQQFSDWLQETEDYLKAELELKATVEEKKEHHLKYQRFHDEVKARQGVLDTVNEKAQALLKTNADAKLSHAITQLTTKYQAALSLCKDSVKKLEGYHGDHKAYKNSLGEFTDWLEDAKVKLKQTNDTSGSKDDVNSRLDQVRNIQAVLDQGQSKLRTLVDNSEKTLLNTNPAGCQIIRQEIDAMKLEYDQLKSQSSTAKRELEEALSHWGDFDRAYDQLNDWMTDTEAKVRGQPEFKADLPEKRSSLEKYRAILGDVEAHRDLLDRLEQRSDQLKDPSAVATLSELRERYQSLLADSKEGVERMEEQVTCHEDYRKLYNDSVSWLSEAKRKLQRLDDSSGDCQSLEGRLKTLQEFHADMNQGEELVSKTAQLADTLRLSTAPRGQDLIGQEIQTLKDDWHTFNVALGEVEANLETGVSDWKQYEQEYSDLQAWLETSDQKVKAMLTPQDDLTRKQQLRDEAQALYEEILEKKADLDNVRSDAENVSQRSSDPRVSTNVMQMSSKYQALVAAAKSMVHRLKENAADHEAYNESYDECLQWLDMTHNRLKECGNSSTDWHTVTHKMDGIKAITSSMDEGLQKVNQCCDLAEKILPNTGGAGKKTIETEIIKLTKDWEDMNKEINDCSGMLEGIQSKWHEYEKYYGSFVKWMTEVEGVLATEPEAKAQLAEKKTQLDKYKLILSDIEQHEQLLTELGDSVANLESQGENPEVAESLAQLQTRYDTLINNAQDTVEELERSYEEHLAYQQAQQDCEKWLLQTSFRLMSHNALNVSTLELTQRQIDKHRALLTEIEDYRDTIEQVTDKGRDLLESNPRVPELRQQVDSEIKNLEESYMNLQATAVQIKNRLADVQKKWQEYQSLLENTDQYLSEDLADWLDAANSDVPDDLQEATKQLEATKAMHEKLTAMKQELSNAAQRCESLSGTESAEQAPGDEESAVATLASQVDENMLDSVNQVESRIGKLRDVIHQWEGTERQRGELRNWLHYKQQEVQELEEKANKLHPEAAELEIAKLQTLREEIIAKGPTVQGFVDRYRTLTQHKPSLADPVVKALQDDWEELVGQVNNLIEEKEKALRYAQDYENRHNDTQEDLDRLAQELERIDRMEATMDQKGLQAVKLKEKATEKEHAVEELRTSAAKLTPTLSRLEQDLVENQLRDVEKHLSDLQCQADKKTRAYKVLGSSLGDVEAEVETYLSWLRERDEELSQKEKLKHTVSYVENRIAENKRLCQDLDSRQSVLVSVVKKMEDLTSDLSKPERSRIAEMIKRVQEDHQHVSQKAKGKTTWLEECLEDREIFLANLEKTVQWLVGKEKALEKLTVAKVQSSDIEKQMEKAKVLMKEVVQHESSLAVLEEQCDKVQDTLDPDSDEEIIKSRQDINIRYNTLKSTLESLSEKLKDSTVSRKELEADIMKVELWCREAEVKCSGELKLDCSLEALEDQKITYLTELCQTMKTEAENYKTLIASIFERAEVFIPSLESSDSTTFQQQLKALRERHFLILTTITERWELLESSVSTRSETQRRITEADSWLTTAQEDIKRLSQPIGYSVEDAQTALKQYETLREKLVNYRPSVADLNQSVETLRSSGHVTDAEDILRITTQHEWLMDQAAQHAERCRQAVTLRHQFADQSEQIKVILSECDDQLRTVKQSSDPVSTKLSTLKVILTKLQSAEPLVGVLQDRAQQINMEGSKDTSQELNSQIVTLQTRLAELRAGVHEETLACERVQQDQEDFEVDLERTIQRMDEKCQSLTTNPLLDLDADKVDMALKRHRVVTDEILRTLKDVKVKVETEKSRFEQGGEPLPENLQQRLQELKSLEQKILVTLESREIYLSEAKSDRLQFESSLRQVTDWLHGAEDLLEANQEGLDYDTICHQLEEHKEYFMEGSLCQDEMEQILELSEKLLPTLDKTDQATLQQSLANINQRVNFVIGAAQKRQDLLERKVTEWRDYDLASQRAVETLNQLEEQWSSLSTGVVRGPDDTNQQLKHSQEFREILERHRHAVDELNSKTRDLDQFASVENREDISQLVKHVNERWNLLVSQVENKQGSLQDLDKEYESYKDIVASLQRHLSEVNLDVPTTEVKGMTSEELTKTQQDVKSQNEKLLVIQPQLATLKKKAQALQGKLPGAEAKVHVQERMIQLIEQFDKVSENVEECEQTVQEEVDDREAFQTEIQQTISWLKDTQQQLSNLRPGKDFAQSQERLEKQKLIEQEVTIRMEQMKRLLSVQTTKYTSENRELPVELRHEVVAMQSLQADLGVAMKEKEEELLRLREDREEYQTLLNIVNTWLEEAASQLKQPIKDLQQATAEQKQLVSEFEPFKEKLKALKEVGREISLHTSNPSEKDSTQKSFSKVSKKWFNLQKNAKERDENLQRACEVKGLIDDKVSEVSSWVQRSEEVLNKPLAATSFEEVKQKLREHKALSKDAERYLARLHDLQNAVKDLGKLCDATPVKTNMDDLSNRIQFIQSQLGDRLHLLEQANTEVLEYERDTAELYHWIDQTRAHLMVRDAGEALKLQLEKQELLLEDIQGQKVRATTILEHPPQTLGLKKVDPVDAARLLRQIDHLSQHATDQLEQLRDAVQLEEEYEQEIHDLTVAIEDAQRQLRDTPVTATNVGALRQQMSEHTSLISASEPNLSSVSGGVKGVSTDGRHLSQRDLSQDTRLRDLNLSWNTLQQQLSAKEKELQLALQKQEKYQESVQSVTDKLDDVQSKLAAPLPNNTEDLQVQMEDYKVMLLELQTVREDIARVRERGRQIMEVSDPEGYRAMKTTLIMLSDRVKSLETATENRGKQLHSALRDREKHEIALEAYRKRVNDLEQWLGQTKQDQRGARLPSETADTLRDQLKENECLQKELTARFQQLSDLAVQCDSLCEMEPAVSADRLRRELADIQSELGELKLETLDNHGKLKTSIKETERREREMGEYEGSVKKLQDWISDTRKLTSAPLSATVAAQMTADQEQLDQLETNLVEHRKLLKSLSQSELKVKGYRGKSEAPEGEAPSVTAAELQLRWQTLSKDLEEKKMLSLDTVQQDSPQLSRPSVVDTRSLLWTSLIDPTVSQLADIHRVLRDLNSCWRHMQTEVKDKQLRLDEALEFQQRFQDALLSASTWLDSVELKLSSPQHGKSTEEELKDTENVLSEIKALQQEILTVNKVSQQLLLEGSGNKVLITQSLNDLNERVRLLETRAYRREAEISRTEIRWSELRSEIQAFRKSLKDATSEFDDLVLQPSFEDRFARNKRLEDQIVRYEAELSRLEDAGSRLARLNPRMSVGTELTILQHSIAELRRRVHENREDLRQFVAVQEQYRKMLTDYQSFLETAEEKLRPDIISARNLEHLNQQLTAHKEFFGDLEEHRSMVDRLALQCGPDTKEKYMVQQQHLDNLTQIIQDKAGLHSQRLGRISQLWTNLDTKIRQMVDHMADVKQRMPSPVSEDDALENVQAKLTKYQTLQQSLNEEKPMVHEIVEKGKQILHSVNCPDLEDTVTELADSFVELHSSVSSELHRTETLVDQWLTFEVESAILQSWFITANSQLSSLKQLTAKDMETIGGIRTKVDKLLEFRKEVDSHLPLKTKVVSIGQQLMRSKKSETSKLEEMLTGFDEQWSQLLHNLDTAEDHLHQAQMELMPSRQALNELLIWLENVERLLKEDEDMAVWSLADMDALLKKYKNIKIDINSKQMTVDFVNETVLHMGQEPQGQPGERTEFAEKLGQLNKRWQLVNSDVTDKLKNLESLREKWDEYEKGVKDLRDWLLSQEERIKKFQLIGNEIHVRQTLRDCKALQDALKNKEDEIDLSRRLVTSLVDVSRGSPGKAHKVTEEVDKLHKQWSALDQKVDQLQDVLNGVLGQWSEYHTELNNLNHVMNETEYSLTRLTSVSSDVHTLKVQVDKLKMLQTRLDFHHPQVEQFATLSNQLMQVCDAPVRQDLQKTLGDLKQRWNNLAVELRSRNDRFGQCLEQWQLYDDQYKSATDWLADKERQYNQLNALKDNPSQRQQCLQESKVLQADLEGFQSQLDNLAKLGEEFTGNLDTPVSGPITLQQAKLTQRLARLQQSLNKYAQNVHEDMTDQTRFQENLNAVTDFLHHAEEVLQQRDPDKSSESKHVKQRLQQLKKLFGEFSDNESNIDSLNDLGYRMALSEAYSEKLLQLNHQWQNLQTDAADRYRRMQALLLLQQDFTEKCGNWLSFLQQAESDLTKDIAGNYPDLVEQQKKSEAFQADIFSRQQILQAIIGDGQRMLLQGEVTDPEAFQRKLAMLSSQWQNVVKQSNHRKTVIDKAVLQWQTYQALCNRISSWLNCREQDLKAFDEENISLQRVKDLLDKARASLKDNSQEDNFKKLNEVCQELLQRADPAAQGEIRETLSSIQQRWHRTLGRFDGQRERLEDIIAQWRLCEQEMEDILSWLGELRRILGTDLPESYDELQRDLNHCKDIEQSFERAEDRRQTLLSKERQLHSVIEPVDLSVLRERIRLLNKQWAELHHQVALRRHRIFDRLNEWSGFNEKYHDLCDWIDQMEVKVSSRTEYHVEDLLLKLQKDYRFEMDTKESAKVELVEQGRQLMKASSEIRATDINNKVAKLEDKWRHLKAVIAYRQHKLQETLLAVQQLEMSMMNLRKWLGDMEHELTSPLIYHQCDLQEIQRKLQQQQELQKDIEKHSPGVASVLNLCDVLLRDSDACPTEVEYAALQQASRTLDRRWRNICQLAADRRYKIDETWKMWQQFESENTKFTNWVKDVKLELREPRSEHADINLIKEDVRHFESVQKKVHENLNQLENINKQYRKMAREGRTDNAGKMKGMMQDANDQWDELSQRVTDIMRHLKRPSGIKVDFETTRTTILRWLQETQTKLTELERNTDMDITTRIAELKVIESEIETNRKRIDYINQTAVYLIGISDPTEAGRIQDLLDHFHRFHGDVLKKVHSYQLKLKKISDGQMETIAKPSLSRETRQSTERETIFTTTSTQREKHKASWRTTTTMEEDTLNWEMEERELSPPGSPPEKRRATARVSPRPGSGLRTVDVTDSDTYLSREERRRRLKEEIELRGRLTQVDAIIEKLVESLEDAAEKLLMTERELRCGTPTGPDTDYAAGNYTELVSECEESINLVRRFDRQLKREAGVTSMPSVDAQVNSVIQRWEILHQKAVDKDRRLGQNRDDWAQFQIDLNMMLTWLGEAEAFLENESLESGEMTLLESVVRKHKDFLLQLDSKKEVVMSLNLVGKNFVYNKSDESRHVRERLRSMNKRWEAVCSQATTLHRDLQLGLAHSQEFHQMIHDLLLWLETVENKLQQIEPVSLAADHVVLRAKYRRLLDLKEDMEDRQPEVIALKETADQLLVTIDSPDMAMARDKTRIIANRLRSLMKRCLTYIRQLENTLGLATRASSAKYDYLDSQDSGLSLSRRPSPRASPYRTRPRSALSKLLFGARSEEPQSDSDTTLLDDGETRRRPAFLARVLRTALPLQILMLALLGFACLVPVCEEEEFGCMFMNNMQKSWTPMLRYTDGPPPT